MPDAVSSPTAEAGSVLRRHGLAGQVQAARSLLLNTWEPWTSAEAGDDALAVTGGNADSAALFRLLHLGQPVLRSMLGEPVLEVLSAAGLCRHDGEEVRPGRWQVSASQGLLAVADREYGNTEAAIHLGEDSLRFMAFVLEAAPAGRVLDVGSGSGISTVAAARSADDVLAVDVLDAARESTGATAELNGVGKSVHVEVVDFRELGDGRHFDTVIANLPGVPIPNGMPYPAAGNGGPDGLRLIRTLWRWFAGQSRCDTLLMRFQSLGPPAGPSALEELAMVFVGYEVRVVTDSAVPAMVRDAITAERVATLGGRRAVEVYGEMAAARAISGVDHFHCSNLSVLRSGSPGIHHSQHHPGITFGRRYRGSGVGVDPAELIPTYVRWLRYMPDEFWSVHGESSAATTLRRIPELGAALQDGVTSLEAARIVLPADCDERPTELAGMALAVAMLAHVMERRRMLTHSNVDAEQTRGLG
ncbi:MAG TPA: 50S ribosomal protein L11 methyltransferase [Acidimicrobiales bacterium]|nr:50S ribosomal protein L11 methyltransferase [Acidimicrobiales bacterium]